jgi:hypothetical protein
MQLPKISMGLTLEQLAQRLRCAECSGPLLGKPVGGRPRGVEGEAGEFTELRAAFRP